MAYSLAVSEKLFVNLNQIASLAISNKMFGHRMATASCRTVLEIWRLATTAKTPQVICDLSITVNVIVLLEICSLPSNTSRLSISLHHEDDCCCRYNLESRKPSRTNLYLFLFKANHFWHCTLIAHSVPVTIMALLVAMMCQNQCGSISIVTLEGNNLYF